MNTIQPTQCFTSLLQLLQQQFDLVSSYIEYLDRIKQSVATNQIEDLNRLIADNDQAIQPLEQVQQQQIALLQQLSFDTDEQGLSRCIKQYDQQQQLTQLHQTVIEKFKELEKSLLVNDLLIRKNQERIRQSIRILSGHQSDNTTTTYSPQGNRSNTHHDKKTLAQA